jgi:uncharacterized membrane protein YcaP (DUF421 family)
LHPQWCAAAGREPWAATACCYAVVVILPERFIARTGSTHRRLETLISADVTLLASEGHLDHTELARTAMPREKVLEAMRTKGRQQLGQVSRLYMEPSGSFSFIPARPSKPGLSVLPAIDDEVRAEGRVEGCCACTECGTTIDAAEPQGRVSERCGSRDWTYAVTQMER